MTENDKIDAFLAGDSFAVVGASQDPSKYGNKVLRAYMQDGRKVYPVNPKAQEVEGLKSYPDLESLPAPIHGISVITPPHVTESIMEQADRLGVKHVWLQPGAESQKAVDWAERQGIHVIYGGPCVLVTLGFREGQSLATDS